MLDQKSNRLLVSAPAYMNDVIRQLPNRRWDGKRKVWTAPVLRANAAAVSRWDADFTPEARAAVDAACQASVVKATSFPHFYPFKRKPRPHQKAAMEHVYGVHATALLMDMRTGKTKVTIDVACASRMEGKIGAVILVCPLSLRKNWVRELKKDAAIPYSVHLLDTSPKGKKDFERWLNTPHDFKWLLVGVESLAAGSAAQLAERFCLSSPNVMCAVDESSKIKNPSATRTKAVTALGRLCVFRQILTGTPMATGAHDLFAQYEFLDPNIIGVGDYYSFFNRYVVRGGFENKQVVGYTNLDELAALVAPFTYQVRQGDVVDMEKVYQVRTVQMSDQQKELYKSMNKLRSVEVGDLSLAASTILEKMMRLHEIAGGSVSFSRLQDEINAAVDAGLKKPSKFITRRIEGANPKIRELLDVVDDHPGPTIVWCAYSEEIRMVVEALVDRYGRDQVVEIHGAVAEADRDKNVYDMFCGLKSRFIVGNAATGGMGLTMDVADNIIYYSSTFNLIDRLQSEERGTASGRSIRIFDIVAEGTVDEAVIGANAAKLDLSEYVRKLISENRMAELAEAGVQLDGRP